MAQLEDELLMLEELIEGHRDAITSLEDTKQIVQRNIRELKTIETGRV